MSIIARLTDGEIIFFTAYALMCVIIVYAWFTRDQRNPGRHRYPETPPVSGLPDDTYPYPYLREFPGDLTRASRPRHARERLATTGELRALAYEGDMDTINAEVARWRAMLPDAYADDDWTTAA